MAARSFNREDADLVARDGQVDLVPVAVCRTAPADERPFVHELTRTVFIAAELGHTPAALKLALVIILAGEGKQEFLLSAAEVSKLLGLHVYARGYVDHLPLVLL